MKRLLSKKTRNVRKTEKRRREMNKIVRLLLVVASVFFMTTDSTWSYPVADTLRYPLDSYVVGDNYFSRYNLLNNNKWHLGDDCGANAGTNVYAIGAGIIRHAQYHAPYWNDGQYYPNYGGMYIIEHNVNGEKVCALYVHMNFATFTKTVGQEVTKGEYLGQVGNRQQNGDFDEHFHFGIRKGEYPADPNAYVYGDWIFSGYTSNESVLNDWHDPSDFIAQHHSTQVLPGQLPDGTINPRILDCYNQFSSIVGQPFDNGGGAYVHNWSSQNGQYHVTIQDFRNSNNEYFAIIDNSDLGQAFLLQGGFRWYYTSQVDGPAFFGAPTTNELVWQYYPWINGGFDSTQPMVTYKRQEFASGAYLLWQFGTTSIIAIDGTGGGFNIALLPGPDLLIEAHALDATSIYVSGSDIGQAYTQVWVDGTYYGDLDPTSQELVMSGFTPDSSYQVEIKAYDQDNQLLDSAGPVTVTTPAESAPEDLNLTLVAKNSSIEVSWPMVDANLDLISQWCIFKVKRIL